MSQVSFTLLPSELLEEIFIYLSLLDLLSASCSNRSLYRLIKNSVELQYSFALQRYGMVDGIKSKSSNDKLKELLRMEESWRTLNLSNRVSVKVQHNASHVYELSNGVYLLGDCASPEDARETEAIRFFDLSGRKTGGSEVREEVWPRIAIPDRVVDLGVSLEEHDLLESSCLSYNKDEDEVDIILHLKQLSTGQPHPLAERSEVVIGISSLSLRKPSVMVGIIGSYLMICLSWRRLFSSSTLKDSLLLVNWMTGDIVLVGPFMMSHFDALMNYLYQREDVPSRTYDGFTFITHDLVLLTNVLAQTLEVIQLPDPTKTDESYGTMFRRVMHLHLPRMNNMSRISRISCRADPIPFSEPHQKLHDAGESPWRGRRECSFSADPSLAIILLRIFGFADDTPRFANLIISRIGLIDAVRSYLSSAKKPEVEIAMEAREKITVEIPWSRWSPGIVRWGKETQSIVITTISGQRFAGVRSHKELVVKDFNQYAVKLMRMNLKTAGHPEGKELWLDGQTCSRLIESHDRSREDQDFLS